MNYCENYVSKCIHQPHHTVNLITEPVTQPKHNYMHALTMK